MTTTHPTDEVLTDEVHPAGGALPAEVDPADRPLPIDASPSRPRRLIQAAFTFRRKSGTAVRTRDLSSDRELGGRGAGNIDLIGFTAWSARIR